MTKNLQILILKQIKEMAAELDKDAISLSTTFMVKKEEFNAEKHTYPLSRKASKITDWADALIEQLDKEKP